MGFRWRSRYPAMVNRLERDLPEPLHFFALPAHLWRKLRTTNVIERCFVEVRRRTRPMVVFCDVESVDRIIYAIFDRFNTDWKTHPSTYLHEQLDVTNTIVQLLYSLHLWLNRSRSRRILIQFMAEGVRDGKLVIPLRQKLPLSEAAEAQATAEKGGIGKILLVA